MTNDQEETLKNFFINTFNQVITLEEKAMRHQGIKDLSVKELHIIEATQALTTQNRNTMTQIAKQLELSVGALTTAVNALVRKGYLVRGGNPADRRIVLIQLTSAGKTAYQKHSQFHEKMTREVEKVLDDQALDSLIRSLDQLGTFFSGLLNEQQERSKKCP